MDTTLLKHNVGTFERLWEEVGQRAGTKWEVKSKLNNGLGKWDDEKTRRLVFEVERVT